MPSRTSTANTLSVFLSLFYIFCFQAHFTRFLTPSMHDQIWAEAPAIAHAFWIGPFQPPISVFTTFLGLLDLTLFVTIVRKKTRILGLKMAAAAVTAGFYANWWNGFIVWPQTVMFGISVFCWMSL